MISGALSFAISVGLLSGLLYLMQPSMVFYPYSELETTPITWGLEYQDVMIDTADGITLHGWYLPKPGAQQVVLFLHGNGGNISHRGDSLKIFNRLGFNILIIDYRGYGRSGGTPSETGLYEDARSAWRYLIGQGFGPEQIILFGRSIGGAVAINLAIEEEPAKLILESTFSSARDMADSLMPLISRVAVMRYPFNSIGRINSVKASLLMLHSPDDEIIPYNLGRKLYQAANPPKQFVDLKGDHNYGFIMSQPGYERALEKFLTRAGAGD